MGNRARSCSPSTASSKCWCSSYSAAAPPSGLSKRRPTGSAVGIVGKLIGALEGYVFDCYSPAARTSVRNIWSQVREKVDDEQTQRVIVNLKDWKGDMTALRRQFDDWPIDGLKELVVVRPDGTIRQIIRQD
ncbi:hypothetical protein ACFHW0_20770 [Micromonospora sp. LOL_025]|uniref:CdiA C-terminal domain-containing protein n=1 Tax=Micromonospora sp. LOL_025 TaxID=3345413 RepID=UPI003A86DEDD